MTIVLGCSNCGDRSGWRIWQSLEYTSGVMEYIWEACTECNADGTKPKPDQCQKCGYTIALCTCNSINKMD